MPLIIWVLIGVAVTVMTILGLGAIALAVYVIVSIWHEDREIKRYLREQRNGKDTP